MHFWQLKKNIICGEGGIDDEPTIRIYNLYEPHPHFTYGTVLGMVPHMKEAKQFCTFYEPVK